LPIGFSTGFHPNLRHVCVMSVLLAEMYLKLGSSNPTGLGFFFVKIFLEAFIFFLFKFFCNPETIAIYAHPFSKHFLCSTASAVNAMLAGSVFFKSAIAVEILFTRLALVS
jgi:hypothetical protein